MSTARLPYTLDEDNLILEWIIKTKLFYSLRGRNFWVDLSNANIFDGRTWQSLQNRFEKKILPNITDTRYTLSDLDKAKIQLAWDQLATDFVSDESDDSDNGDNSDDSDNSDDNVDNGDEGIASDEISSSTHSSGDLNNTILSDESEHVSRTGL